MTCTMDMSECGRYGWIDEIENNALYCAICKLNTNQKELLTLLYRDGYTLSEVADRIYHTSVAAVSLRLLPHTKANPPICCGEWRAEK